MISIKLDAKIKKEAQQAAEELGLTLSAIVNATLHEFARTRELHVGGSSHPTPYLERILKDAEKEIEKGEKMSPIFGKAEDAIAYLRKEMAK